MKIRFINTETEIEKNLTDLRLLKVNVDGFTFFGEPSTYEVKCMILLDGDEYHIAHHCPWNDFMFEKLEKMLPVVEVEAKTEFDFDNSAYGNPDSGFSKSTVTNEYKYLIGAAINNNNESYWFVNKKTARKIGIADKKCSRRAFFIEAVQP